ncbi:MAG: dihydrodipicolinate synthase family protein [Candidatus Omnitrophica bacterium]|nr:dihydrodipicolinate synthase family protein [Candidatus Omnitrophota bacterium]MCA9426503.1 dihydrodipicolinate synthase family protein [Candidatus Omnitrophota bacterium]MCA9430221.1 dihydrodipicolinate synthase family protein [Candidatus Omnitrophota bacterium]MCA9438001.1 dihydrodipicolinate synthase family protein [Candidatus Omnitrophota bacterium]MCB9769180.1 dihydrodipicolinate synthase family protein [Candidatus Omnitrophota bacterium]
MAIETNHNEAYNGEWGGVLSATLCPFHEDYSIDEESLREYLQWVASFEGVRGLVANGHTGEIMSLRPEERARVTRITAETVKGKVKVVSGVSCEGSLEAIDHAIAAKEAGADAILLMPPHHWLRFGRTKATAVGFIEDVAEGADIKIIVHQYPAWTKAGYTLDEMLEMIEIPQVVSIKMGTRDMARLRFDYEKLKEAAPHVSIISCHDEYLLASILEGADGALVGFAGYAPGLIVELVSAGIAGDLARARKVQSRVEELSRIIYQFGEPSSDAHQRMKCALYLQGMFSSPLARPPLRPLKEEDIEGLREGLINAGVEVKAVSEAA